MKIGMLSMEKYENRGREMAIERFHIDRWMNDWADFLEGVVK